MQDLTRGALDGLSVLVVDDNQDQLDLLTAVLSFQGGRVIVADSGRQALACLQESPVDVIVSDLAMPGLSGMEFIRAVRRGRSAPRIPAIAVTAFYETEPRAAALAAGFQQHLLKPLDYGTLVREILHLTRRDPSAEAET